MALSNFIRRNPFFHTVVGTDDAPALQEVEKRMSRATRPIQYSRAVHNVANTGLPAKRVSCRRTYTYLPIHTHAGTLYRSEASKTDSWRHGLPPLPPLESSVVQRKKNRRNVRRRAEGNSSETAPSCVNRRPRAANASWKGHGTKSSAAERTTGRPCLRSRGGAAV